MKLAFFLGKEQIILVIDTLDKYKIPFNNPLPIDTISTDHGSH